MQRTGARNVRKQVLHLVGKDPATFEINILGIRWRKRHRDQLHGRLLRRPATLVVIAAPAGGSDVVPGILAAEGQRCDVIAGQVARLEPHCAIEAKVGVALEEGAIVQGWHVPIPDERQALAGAFSRDDRVDVDLAAAAVKRTVATEYRVQPGTAGIRNLLGMVKTNRFAVVDPLKRHSRYIGPQDLLRDI